MASGSRWVGWCLALVATACAPTLAQLTADHVGCTADELSAGRLKTAPGGSEWEATCHGQVFVCTNHPRTIQGAYVTSSGLFGIDSQNDIGCTPKVAVP